MSTKTDVHHKNTSAKTKTGGYHQKSRGKTLEAVIVLASVIIGYFGVGRFSWLTTNNAVGILLGTVVGSIIALIFYIVTDLGNDLLNIVGLGVSYIKKPFNTSAPTQAPTSAPMQSVTSVPMQSVPMQSVTSVPTLSVTSVPTLSVAPVTSS